MSVVPITINGVAYPKEKSADMQPFPVTIVGYAWLTGLTVSGGPLPPPTEPPIEEPPPETPVDQMLTLVAKPPPAEGGWGFFPEYGWVWYPAGSGPQPKR
jgi:hypothetical protein